ncbi:MAG: CoA transferase [Candidatus Binataceae bacterium]|jgi:crotonobetainyl-CoA:carnitine CoA-transferase CaiB-like acyl-CoA transferase
MAGILDGIRVFDLTIAAVGPWATKLLGALGADVIKVEMPGGDALSHAVPPRIKGSSVLYISANHNKRMIELNLKNEADRAVALELAKLSDVFVNNMRPGAVDRLGLSYSTVSRINPRIVYILACAYGATGPMAGEAGIDPTVQAFSGWCSITGPEHGRGEMFRHLAHIDLTTATVVAQAALQGLLARERTGKGQLIEVEMLRAAMAIQTTRLAEYFATGAQPPPLGSAASTTVPHQAFECADGKYLAVGVVSEDQWPRMCGALGLDQLADDPRFATNRDRVAHRADLIPLLAERFKIKPAAWWMIRLSHAQVPNGPFMSFQELRYHPQAIASGGITEIDTPHWGRLSIDGLPWQFDRTPAGPIRAGGLPGEHAAEILAELGIAPAAAR